MKLKEGRDIYVTDEMLALVYSCSAPVIQDAIDLAYLTGQRPADVLKRAETKTIPLLLQSVQVGAR